MLRCVPPQKGLRETPTDTDFYRASVPAGHDGRGVSLSYRAFAPRGAGLPSGIEWHHSDAPQPTANYSLLTANSSFVSGGGGLQEIDMVEEGQSELIVSHQERFEELFNNLAACLDADFHSAEDMLKPLYKWQNVKEVETDCYWYHPDHLGSSSWITDSAGAAVQHLHYLPWGEDFVDQRTGSFSSMYTFSAKEKDAETGYSYFGSRYYSSDLSIWLSVDPMADKYPSLSPYTYCADNPVKLVDPNGDEVDDNFDKWKYNKTTGELSWYSNTGGKCHQIVVETENTSAGEQVRRTVEFDGAIGQMFDFSLVSKTVDCVISGVLEMSGGATMVGGGAIIGVGGSIITGGASVPTGGAVLCAGTYLMYEGLVKITNAIAGHGVDLYEQQELVRDICISSGCGLAGILSELKHKPFTETIKNTSKSVGKSFVSFFVSAAWSTAVRYRTTHPKYKGLPTGSKVY